MLAQCPCFEGQSSEFAEAGTARHKALSDYLGGAENALDELEEEEADGVRWAAEYIRLHAPMADYPVEFEVKRRFFTPQFVEMTGTPDVTCGAHVFDLKWRRRDYTAQMACYALMLMESGWEQVTAHVLFGESKTAVRLEFDRDSAEAVIVPILEEATEATEATAGTKGPRACEYCGWCARAATCPALTVRAEEVVNGYGTTEAAKNWHPSKMETGQEIAEALRIWRTVLKPWGKSIEFHAMEALVKKGLTLPGVELKATKGKTFVTDVPGAFAQLGMPQEEFLKCCELRLNSSKKYPDKLGLAQVYAGLHGMKGAPAKREALRRLEPVLKVGEPGKKLVLTGEEEEEE
jgi:hypothetical protein